MNIIFENLNPIYQNGMADFLKLHNISIADGGLKVKVSVNPDVNIKIKKNNNNVVFIGDSEVDVQTGLNAKLKTIACTWGFRTIEELQGAHYFANAPKELIKIFEGINNGSN